jgi:hypothetical protein
MKLRRLDHYLAVLVFNGGSSKLSTNLKKAPARPMPNNKRPPITVCMLCAEPLIMPPTALRTKEVMLNHLRLDMSIICLRRGADAAHVSEAMVTTQGKSSTCPKALYMDTWMPARLLVS